MNVPMLELYVNEKRIPYLKCVGDTQITDEKACAMPKDIAEMLKKVYSANCLPEERVWMVAFDSRLHITGLFEVSRGTANTSCVSQIQILQRAVLSGAFCVALAHCHPSGDISPSREDEEVTRRIGYALETCGIKLIDHVIVAGANRDEYFSFKEEDLL